MILKSSMAWIAAHRYGCDAGCRQLFLKIKIVLLFKNSIIYNFFTVVNNDIHIDRTYADFWWRSPLFDNWKSLEFSVQVKGLQKFIDVLNQDIVLSEASRKAIVDVFLLTSHKASYVTV
jgi:hypothetical protein